LCAEDDCLELALTSFGWHVEGMTATLIINEDGKIDLPEDMRLVFGVKAGLKIKAEFSADRIELVKDIQTESKTTRSASGRLVVAPTSVRMDAAMAVCAERDALSGRSLKR